MTPFSYNSFKGLTNIAALDSVLPSTSAVGHKTTTRVLALIANEIRHGRPLWAILWANRHFPPHSTIRQALLRKAIERIGRKKRTKAIDHITQRIVAGETLDTLPLETTRLIARIEPVDKTLRTRKVPPVFYRQRTHISIPNSRLSSIVRS